MLSFRSVLQLCRPGRDNRQWRSLLFVCPDVDQETLAVTSHVVEPGAGRELEPEQGMRREHMKFLRRLTHSDGDKGVVVGNVMFRVWCLW